MRSKTIQTALVLGLILPIAALASTPASIPEGVEQPNDPTSMTIDVKARVAEVREDGTLVVIDLENETRHAVRLEDNVKIRARQKKLFQGRRKLSYADLREGQIVKITAMIHDGSIRKITVLQPAAA